MNPPKLQYLNLKYESDNYPITPVQKMTDTELSRWFAFCNFIKFTSLYCKKNKMKFADVKWNYLDVLAYVDDTSGDIRTILRQKKGIPMKYSLNKDDSESEFVEEIQYDL